MTCRQRWTLGLKRTIRNASPPDWQVTLSGPRSRKLSLFLLNRKKSRGTYLLVKLWIHSWVTFRKRSLGVREQSTPVPSVLLCELKTRWGSQCTSLSALWSQCDSTACQGIPDAGPRNKTQLCLCWNTVLRCLYTEIAAFHKLDTRSSW